MDISDQNLQKFREWLIGRGRVPGTADLYLSNLRSCAADPGGLTHRLVGGDLSPNSLRTNLAALRAWAKFGRDSDLQMQLADMRLPPARRLRTKAPLSLEEWRKVIRHIKVCKMTCRTSKEAVRQVILIIAIRGLRAGDVLRLRRTEVVRSLDSGKLAFEGKGRKRQEFSAIPIRDQLQALADMPKWTRVRDLVSDSKNISVLRQKIRRATIHTARHVGIKEMNPHRYRHTFATNYLAQLKGDPNAIVKLQYYMGWESMETAARYVSHISHDELDLIGAGLISEVLG